MVRAVLLLFIKIICSFVHRMESQEKVNLDFDNTGAISTWQSFAMVF